MTQLHVTNLGESGPRVAFCHGLFGQGKNWGQLGKQLAADGYRVTLVDMPNHGQSEWTQEFTYTGMADIVAEQLREIGGDDRWTLVGHSMGGKAAMLAALRHPDLFERLVVVDISPVDYHGLSQFVHFTKGMKAMDLDAITSRAEADEAMKPYAGDRTVRAFLLQNLRRDGDGFRWQINLGLLTRALPDLGAWPADEIPEGTTYDGPTLWVAGENSPYVKDEYDDAMRALFPKVRQVTIKGSGHWVHSERPDVFAQTLRAFLERR